MPAPDAIAKLVDRYAQHADSYQQPSYNETALRREFIDPFFRALGWDVDNESGYAEAYKDVIHEYSLRMGESTNAPDYCFRIGGVPKFFVETKKPSVDIKSDVGPAFQLRRYAWTAKLPLSILTDFEEFAVYDCLAQKPVKTDKASHARTMYLRYTDYLDRWDELAELFSPEAIRRGSFDKYAASGKRKRGTAEVDDAFLREIEEWRNELAKNLALRNPELSQRELNFAVQRTIDRIVFLRICEDRGIEEPGQLQALLNGNKVYPRLCELFQQADDRFNSGLFHFTAEKGRGEPDELTLSLNIDDKTLKPIIKRLYYPESPYAFAVMPADILGQVYEQFLGKVIRLTRGHQAKIEEKPEVKKAGGVYYTPTYIVDYIVQQTVGKLVEGRTPQEVGGLTKTFKPSKRARPLSVLDPACGSGSFLIGAYQYLLDWYRDWYEQDGPARHKERLYQAGADDWRLTTAERKRILLAHIYGVDIDPQAVEVTKLSLLLKVLEGENRESLKRQRQFLHERALPDLGANIKCGNSLIGPDFYRGKQLELFDEEEMLRINAFDWGSEFKEIMAGGGFDAVIGNPPYLNAVEERTRFSDECAEYVRKKFNAAKGAFDASILFQESGLHLLCDGGRTSMIVPNKFMSAPFGRAFRSYASSVGHLDLLADFSTANVFRGVGVYPVIYAMTKSNNGKATGIQTERWTASQEGLTCEWSRMSDRLSAETDTWDELFSTCGGLLDKIKSLPRIKDFFDVCASATVDEAYRIKPFLKQGNESKGAFRFLTSGAIDRYRSLWTVKTIRYLKCNYSRPILPQSCPELSENRLAQYASPKLIIAGMTKRLEAIYDSGEIAGAVPTLQILAKANSPLSLKALLAIVNSQFVDWVFRQYFGSLSLAGGYLRIGAPQLKELPIPVSIATRDATVDLTSLEELVENLQAAHMQLDLAKTAHERCVHERRINELDMEIDRIVFRMFGICDEEILSSIEAEY